MNFDMSIFDTIGGIVKMIFVVIFGLVAIGGGILLHFTVFSKKNEGKYTGFMGWLYDFFNFKKLMIIPFLKLAYIIAALDLTLTAIFKLTSAQGFIDCLMELILGNITLRIGYELALLIVKGVRDISDLNAKTEGEGSEFNKRFCDSALPVYEKTAAPAQPAAAAPVAAPAPAPTPVAAPAPVPTPAPVYSVPTPVEEAPAPAPVELAKPVSAVPTPVEPAAPVSAIPTPVEHTAPVELNKPVEAAPAEAAAPVEAAPSVDEILAAVPAPAPAEPAAATKICPNCGKELTAAAKFCGGCGTKQD